MRLGQVIAWIVLLLLIPVEFALSWLGFGIAAPCIGIGMVLLVAFAFMRIHEAPNAARIFALASVFWLSIMLGLGVMDPVTRHDYPSAVRSGD